MKSLATRSAFVADGGDGAAGFSAVFGWSRAVLARLLLSWSSDEGGQAFEGGFGLFVCLFLLAFLGCWLFQHPVLEYTRQ